jgi:hypothetical protein
VLGAGVTPVASTPDPTAGASTGVFTLAVGDCINPGAAGAAVTDVLKIDCGVPHESEAYASVVMTDAAFPGDQAVADKANAGCTSEFKKFVGIDYSKSALSYSFYFPTQASWGQGDREILCLVLDSKAKTTGTLKGAARSQRRGYSPTTR